MTKSFSQSMLPAFSEIDPNQIKPEIEKMLKKNRERLKATLEKSGPYTWENLMQTLEEMNDELSKKWSPIGHLHSVKENEALRKAYNETLPLLTEYHTELSQNEKLFEAISSIRESNSFHELSRAQQKIIENDLRDFKLAGIHLSPEKKARMAELQKQLSQLTTAFSENLLDSTQGYLMQITDKSRLKGLPQQALQLAIDNAKRRNLEGYVFTLDYPSYSTAIKFLEDRELRRELYYAYATRASDQGPNANKWDNTPIMEKIMQARQEMAQLVGYPDFADYSLASKMAKNPDDVLRFLNDLLTRSKPIAEEEYKEIIEIAKKIDGLSDVQVWDTGYYSEKLCEATFQFSQEDLRPYFPIQKVLKGMFELVNKIYGLKIVKQDGIDVWDNQVEFFAIYDEKDELRGGFYIDLYARPHKRDGAWMDECRVRHHYGKDLQYPVAYLTCNFMPPVEGKPALLTHDDVLTLFHEFGHCLHHMLTKVNYPSVAGINGVPWDAVEFPSQFMENFCWEKESLDLIAAHYQTHEPLPEALYQKMLDAKHFQTGLQMARQLEFSLFDFELHLKYVLGQPDGQIQTILNQIRNKVGIIPVPPFNRFQNSFSHIFAGGYAAGYYSYKWAEVLSADAYSMFEENGIFDRATGRAFMENILEVGGERDPKVSFIAFRGREPKIDALLRHSGITKGEVA